MGWFSKLSDAKKAIAALAGAVLAGVAIGLAASGFTSLPDRVVLLEADADTVQRFMRHHRTEHRDLDRRLNTMLRVMCRGLESEDSACAGHR